MIINFLFFILFVILINYLSICFLAKMKEQMAWVLLALVLPFIFAFVHIIICFFFEINIEVLTYFSMLYIQVLYIGCCFPLSVKKVVYHLFIYLLFLVYSLIVYYINTIKNIGYSIPYDNINYILRFILSIFYGILIYLNKESKTNDEIEHKINWLLRHASLIFIIFDILRVFMIKENHYSDFEKITIASFISVYIILIKVYFLIKRKKDIEKEYFISLEKRNESDLSKLELIKIIDKINIYFLESNSYLRAGYNLSDLSKALKIPKKQISKALKKIDTNFYNLLAEYRIDYAKKIILKKNNHTIESLAHQCGFNSKTSFNFYFKKATGNTPSEYRKIYSDV